MGEWIKLKASDGFELSAWRAEPKGAPRGGLVVVQEIFGVNAHVRSVADGFAADGYLAIAPAIFDRAEPGFDVGYGPEAMAHGRALAGKTARGDAARYRRGRRGRQAGGKVGVVGYCLGGTLAWVAAARSTAWRRRSAITAAACPSLGELPNVVGEEARQSSGNYSIR